MIRLVKHAFRKLLIQRLFNRFVANDAIVKKDIEQTIAVRGCNVKSNTISKKFNHLMLYYPEYAFIFFWRNKLHKYRWRKLFTKDFNAKIFGNTKIGGGLMCYHPFATVINAKSIGENFQFRNSLTIGNKNNDNSILPTIGDNVTVGANVVIIGGIEVGDNVIIGACSVVVKDVPSNVVIAGNPATVIRTLDND